MKAAKAGPVGKCDQYKVDKNGRCPGDTGYVSFVKDDVPKDFAVSHLPWSYGWMHYHVIVRHSLTNIRIRFTGLRRRDEGQESRRRQVNSPMSF